MGNLGKVIENRFLPIPLLPLQPKIQGIKSTFRTVTDSSLQSPRGPVYAVWVEWEAVARNCWNFKIYIFKLTSQNQGSQNNNSIEKFL